MKGELAQYSVKFSIRVVEYYKWLTENKREFVMSKQILRSRTSIGANIHEAEYAVSRPDFRNKLQIAAKEANETEYWLIILQKPVTMIQPLMIYSLSSSLSYACLQQP